MFMIIPYEQVIYYTVLFIESFITLLYENNNIDIKNYYNYILGKLLIYNTDGDTSVLMYV